MKRPLLRAALAAALVAGALAAQSGGPAASADVPTAWFSTAAASSPEAAAVASRREFVRTRLARFDATGAVHALVRPTDMVAAEISGRTIVKPLKDRLVVALVDGIPTTVVIDEVAVGVTQDIGPGLDGTLPPTPTVEVLGHVGAAGTSQSLVAFVFIPDAAGRYRMAGTADNSPRDLSTSIVPLDGDAYALGVIKQSSDAAPDEPTGGAGGPDDGHPGPDPVIPPDLGAYVNGKTAADTKPDAPIRTVDLGVAYANGSPSDIVTQINVMVRETNIALARSEVNVRLDLLFTHAVDYNQDTKDPSDPNDKADLEDDLNALYAGTGKLKEIHTRRADTGVDLVALLVPQQNTACGMGYIPAPGGNRNARWSVTAMNPECTAKWTFSHEVGHNLGGNHNPEVTADSDPPYSYARGHRIVGKVRDLMAYACYEGTTDTCKRNVVYSNPDVPFPGYPDLPSGTTQRNNARSMRNLSAAVSAYDTRKPMWDVPTTDPFYSQIRWTVDQGFLTCGSDLAFRKTDTVNRGAMAAIAYRRSGSPAYTPPTTSPFSDVPTTHTFYKAITWANSKGVMTGYANGTFGPGDRLTRGQTAVVLYSVMGNPAYTPPATSPFPDVATTAYYYKAVTWAVSKGIANGYANGNFGPNDDVLRGQMSVVLYNARSMTAAP